MYYDPNGGCYVCGDPNAHRFVNGRFCPAHHVTPPLPDPTRTAAALRLAGGIVGRLSPFAVKGGSDIVKERTGGYVSKERAARIAAGTAPRPRSGRGR